MKLSWKRDEEGYVSSDGLRIHLDGGSRRWVKGANPHVRYVFRVIEEEALTVDERS